MDRVYDFLFVPCRMSGKSSNRTRRRAKRVDPSQPKEILKRTMKQRVENVYPRSARLANIAAQRAATERQRQAELNAYIDELFKTKKKKKKAKKSAVKEND